MTISTYFRHAEAFIYMDLFVRHLPYTYMQRDWLVSNFMHYLTFPMV